MEEPTRIPHKPSKSHPWRKFHNNEIRKWAKEESDLLPLTTITVARPETLRDRRRREGT